MPFEPLDFEEIRPYTDAEIPGVLQALSLKPSFPLLLQHLYPGQDPGTLMEELASVRTVAEFQARYIRDAIRSIISSSIRELSWEGIESLSPGSARLFLSNHRDIILDSALLNLILHEAGLPTSRIAIGDNLLISPLVTGLMKINKSFIVHRNAPPHLLYAYSDRLSRYIQASIAEGQSVWLAQRNGRAKDGTDETAPGLLKMLLIAHGERWREAFSLLRLTPMAVSYEYEPCGGLKAEESWHRERHLPYSKDDKAAMIQGIQEAKGRVHLAIGPAFDPKRAGLSEGSSRNEWLRGLAQWIDGQILDLYRCFPAHYLAADLAEGSRKREALYAPEDEEAFAAHLERQLAGLQGDREEIRQHFLRIHAQPVWRKEQKKRPA